MSNPAVRPRPMGGFNQGLGQFNEHLDEEAMHAAVQQKGLGQQATLPGQPTTGGSTLGGQQAGQTHGQPGAHQPPAPREVGTIPEELVARPAQDVVAGLKSFFDINDLLNIQPAVDDPETQAKKRTILREYQKFEKEDQAVIQKKFQQEMEKKKHEQEEAQVRKQKQAQASQQSLNMPTGKHDGAVGPGQKKPAAVAQLEADRKTLGGPQNVG